MGGCSGYDVDECVGVGGVVPDQELSKISGVENDSGNALKLIIFRRQIFHPEMPILCNVLYC